MSREAEMDAWRQVYDLAWQIQQMAPWKLLRRADLIGVEQPTTGELGFLSVSDGSSFPAISVYRNARGLYGFWYSHDMPLPAYPEQYLEIPQISVDFKGRAEVDAHGQALIAQLGLDEPQNGLYPVFRSVQPGYRPWYLDADEADFLLCVFQQALDVLPRAMLNPDLVQPKHPDRFVVRAQNVVSGQWRDTFMSIPQPGSEPILFMMDHELFAKVKRFPHQPVDVEMDFFMVLDAPEKPLAADKRTPYPYMYLTVDAALGLILGHELLSPTPTLEAMWGLVSWKLVSQCDKLGFIPRTVLVRSPLLVQVLSSFNQELGFTLKEVQALPGVDGAKAILRQLKDQ
jgi:hypothetical protein